jgi:hypothetical protein
MKEEDFVKTLYDPETTRDNICAICHKQVHDLSFKAHIDCVVNDYVRKLV